MVLFYFFILCFEAKGFFFFGVLIDVKQCFLRKWMVVETSEVFTLLSAMIPVDTQHSINVRDCRKTPLYYFHPKNKNKAHLLHVSFFKALNQFSAIPRLSPMDSFRLLHVFHREEAHSSTPDVVCFSI